MVLHEARTFDALVEIGVIAHVDNAQTQTGCGLSELCSIQHVNPFVDGFETHGAVIGDMKLLAVSFLGGNLDDTCCASRTVLCCFRGILQNRETLDVGRVDGREGCQVGCHTVDDDQRVVATCQRGRSSDAYCRYHCLLIGA